MNRASSGSSAGRARTKEAPVATSATLENVRSQAATSITHKSSTRRADANTWYWSPRGAPPKVKPEAPIGLLGAGPVTFSSGIVY